MAQRCGLAAVSGDRGRVRPQGTEALRRRQAPDIDLGRPAERGKEISNRDCRPGYCPARLAGQRAERRGRNARRTIQPAACPRSTRGRQSILGRKRSVETSHFGKATDRDGHTELHTHPKPGCARPDALWISASKLEPTKT